MSKQAASKPIDGVLIRPFEAFYNSPVPVGTKCEITNEEEDRYAVKFPGLVGYSGSFHIKKIYVEIT